MNCYGKASLPPLRAVPPTEAQGYLSAAHGLFEGVEALAACSPSKFYACAFLSAQVLECALKAFLASAGWTEKELRSRFIRHNLNKLWAEAVAAGLAVPVQPPQWCVSLNLMHDKPYYFRYPMGLNGMGLPAPGVMIPELRELISSLRDGIYGKIGQ